jgi:KaiC/GvpD/RAD55 family RecA-like ATPase
MTLFPASTNEPDGIRAASDRGLSLATAISGTPGSGKTTLAAVFALWGLLNGWGQVLIDPTGSLSTAFLHQVESFLSEFPEGEDELLWQRIRYVRIGAIDHV